MKGLWISFTPEMPIGCVVAQESKRGTPQKPSKVGRHGWALGAGWDAPGPGGRSPPWRDHGLPGPPTRPPVEAAGPGRGMGGRSKGWWRAAPGTPGGGRGVSECQEVPEFRCAFEEGVGNNSKKKYPSPVCTEATVARGTKPS